MAAFAAVRSTTAIASAPSRFAARRGEVALRLVDNPRLHVPNMHA